VPFSEQALGVDYDRRKGAPHVDSRKYIGMDVHQASISVAVRDGAALKVKMAVEADAKCY